MDLKNVWNKIFHSRKNCKYYSGGFCLDKLAMLEIRQVMRPDEDLMCNGMCDNFERRK